MCIKSKFTLFRSIIDPPECSSTRFFTHEALRQRTIEANINRVQVKRNFQKVYPDITFTCNGSITKWIVGAGTGGGSSPPSELQIWRRSGSEYIKVGSTQLTAQSPTSDPNVYEYIPSPPLGFKEGDILGVYTRTRSPILAYFQANTGPANVLVMSNVAPSVVDTSLDITSFLYPLVTVETSVSGKN